MQDHSRQQFGPYGNVAVVVDQTQLPEQKFRKLGLIDYKGNEEIIVRAELLTDVVLHD